jgi:hypothetical protein
MLAAVCFLAAVEKEVELQQVCGCCILAEAAASDQWMVEDWCTQQQQQ